MSAIQIPVGSLIPGVAAVIPISTTKSNAFATTGMNLVGLSMPAAFTGATISFEVSSSLAGTYVPLYKIADNTLVSLTVTAGRAYSVDPALFNGFAFMKIVSASSEAAARTITLTLKG